MEGVNDESSVHTASFPLAQTESSVEHVILKQDALAHPDYIVTWLLLQSPVKYGNNA